MQVRMMHEVLAPGMKHGEEADLRTQVFRIRSNRAEGFRNGSGQNAVDDFLVLEGDEGNRFWHSKDDMEVLDRQ